MPGSHKRQACTGCSPYNTYIHTQNILTYTKYTHIYIYTSKIQKQEYNYVLYKAGTWITVVHYMRNYKSSLLMLHDGTCVTVVHHTRNYKCSLLTLHAGTCITVIHHTKNYKYKSSLLTLHIMLVHALWSFITRRITRVVY